jgi:hypothetical protein
MFFIKNNHEHLNISGMELISGMTSSTASITNLTILGILFLAISLRKYFKKGKYTQEKAQIGPFS